MCLLARGQRAPFRNLETVLNTIMKTDKAKKRLMFGDLIRAAYLSRGKRRSIGILRLAVNARLIEFRGRQRFEISD